MRTAAPAHLASLKQARQRLGWTQAATASRLGLSQGYLSLLESGRRRVPGRLVSSMRRLLHLPVTTLPVQEHDKLSDRRLASALAGLGYEPLAYLRGRKALNPAAVLLAALRRRDLDPRLTEALPWLVLMYAQLDWRWLLERAKVYDVQNRLGYVLSLARQLAEMRKDATKAEELLVVERLLEPSRLAREDTLCHDSMQETERKWVRTHRPPLAAHWNLLTDLAPDHLSYAG